MKMLYTRWKDIDWVLVKSRVFEWQQVIYSASKLGDVKTVRKYQHRIIGSIDAKFLAVRRITQENKAKSMSSIDMVKAVFPEKRLEFAKSLFIPTKPSPLCRVSISKTKKGNSEKNWFRVPTIKDRCLQVLFKLALEPEWEAKFEENSYGFRPGRNAHDAIASVRCFVQKRPKYVLYANVTESLGHLNHEKLLEKIGMVGKYRRQLKYWLRNGILDQNVFLQSEVDTPEFAIISPLLANIALHGVEEFCKDLIKDIAVYGSTGELIKPMRRCKTLGFVRYADSFVIIHPDLKVITLLQDKLKEFLIEIGIQFSATKTCITHTLEINPATVNICPGLKGKPGFIFLGFYIRSYKTCHLSAFSTNGEKLGFRTIIVPSKEECNSHQEKLHDIVLRIGKKLSQDVLIKKLRPVIRKWASYFGKSDANTMGLLGQMDYLLYLKVRQWAKRIYKTSGKGKVVFRRIGNDKWRFATGITKLNKHIDYSFPLSKYVKIRGEYSPYDQHFKYWADRLTKNNNYNTRINLLLLKQKGKCNWCQTQFMFDDIFEIDHITPKSQLGSDDFANLQLLHRHCHHSKTSLD